MAPKGGAPNGGGPKFCAFFPSPATVFILFSLSFGLFRGILVVFEAPGRSNVHVWSSRAVVCEPRRDGLVGLPGFHMTVREPKRAHLRSRSSKTPPKFNEKDQQERKKRMKIVAERNFGRSGGGGSGGRILDSGQFDLGQFDLGPVYPS